MVKLRLKRRGRKKAPVYDIVATDSRSPRDGRFIERVGQYSPLSGGSAITMLNRERALHWLQTGAQPTDTVRSLFRKEGLLLELTLNRKGVEASEVARRVEEHQARRQQNKPAAPAKPAPQAAAPAAAPAPAAEPTPEPTVDADRTSATEKADAQQAASEGEATLSIQPEERGSEGSEDAATPEVTGDSAE